LPQTIGIEQLSALGSRPLGVVKTGILCYTLGALKWVILDHLAPALRALGWRVCAAGRPLFC